MPLVGTRGPKAEEALLLFYTAWSAEPAASTHAARLPDGKLAVAQGELARQVRTGGMAGHHKPQRRPVRSPTMRSLGGGPKGVDQFPQPDLRAQRVIGQHHMQAARPEGRRQPSAQGLSRDCQ